MRYMLICYDDEKYWQQAGQPLLDKAQAQAAQLCQEMDQRAQYILASPLQPSATAKTVRVRGGQTLITDGPYAETREVLGGFYLIEASDVHEALRIAAQHPGVHVGAVEVRPLVDLRGLPEPRNESRRS